MDELAKRYVGLILGIGHHDANYVDAYYGPQEWRPAKLPLEMLAAEASDLSIALRRLAAPNLARHNYLTTQTLAATARIRMLGGERFSFDEEAKALYDVTPPIVSQKDLESALEELDKSFPGPGSLAERYGRFDARFRIPADRVDAAFRAAIAEARLRTRKRIPALPAKETFDIEYVRGKSWSAYNWYKGGAHSLIQVNVDQPIGIDRILHLACHEGYPGHHVYNALLEAELVRERGWWEYSVYALYSPQSLIAEGTADFGNSLVLPDKERLAFKREVLFKEAGLDPDEAAEQHRVLRLLRPLRHAPIQAARDYLDGRRDAAATIEYLERYTLQNRALAERRVKFFDEHRSYIVNYSYGEDLIAAWVLKTAGKDENARWKSFLELLSTPRTPANLL